MSAEIHKRESDKRNTKRKGGKMKNYTEVNVYSDVEKIGFLPKKEKYTMKDVNKLIVESLFCQGGTLLPHVAAFVVKCSAIHHGASYSKTVANVPVSIV